MKDLGSPTCSRERPERPPDFITATPTLTKGTALDLKGWGRIVLQLKERKPQCPTEREKGKSMKLTEGRRQTATTQTWAPQTLQMYTAQVSLGHTRSSDVASKSAPSLLLCEHQRPCRGSQEPHCRLSEEPSASRTSVSHASGLWLSVHDFVPFEVLEILFLQFPGVTCHGDFSPVALWL